MRISDWSSDVCSSDLGSLAGVSAADLGATAIREALTRSGVAPERVDYVIMGYVIQAGTGQIPARQAAVAAGIPNKEIGRAACRERVCRYVVTTVVEVSFNTKIYVITS